MAGSQAQLPPSDRRQVGSQAQLPPYDRWQAVRHSCHRMTAGRQSDTAVTQWPLAGSQAQLPPSDRWQAVRHSCHPVTANRQSGTAATQWPHLTQVANEHVQVTLRSPTNCCVLHNAVSPFTKYTHLHTRSAQMWKSGHAKTSKFHRW